METENRREDILLEQLKADSAEYGNLETRDYSVSQKRQAIRSLMNIRMPGGLSEALLAAQDEYLRQTLSEKGIVTLAEIPTIRECFGGRCAAEVIPFADQISLWQGDITRLQAGAIVNAANSQMLGCFVPCHRCIDNAIHSAAGMQLREECSRIMAKKRMCHGGHYEEPVGGAVLTKAYNLPSDHVIHTVGPIVYGGLTDAVKNDLRSCYESVLQCCVENGIRSVAFCCISTGEFHFPNREAAKIAVKTVTAFLGAHENAFDRVIFNVFKDEDREIYERIFASA
ncbi:MAG: protein-ADP-ribose hydrolase [Bacteroidales bacterium]|nr:protein-ADP-ribose hydrolase [Bacteroidales bacterium]MCM1414602.1 protein-ADP-ribose hydrolase [bacterium]MCM1423964.1 protein-ADP-ribose hydrolase [bacterium]